MGRCFLQFVSKIRNGLGIFQSQCSILLDGIALLFASSRQGGINCGVGSPCKFFIFFYSQRINHIFATKRTIFSRQKCLNYLIYCDAHSLMHHCNLIPLTPVPSGSLSHILAHSDSVWLSQAIIDSQGLCSALHVVARGHNLNSFLELTLFTLLSLFILFKLFYTALTFACIPIYVHCQGRLKGYWNGLMGF